MKFIFYTCVFFVGTISHAQSDTLNRVDADGKKYGYWIIYGKNRPESGFAPHTIIEEGRYESEKKTGIWKTYYRPGVLKSEIEYINNRPNGKFVIYYENEQIEETGTWKGTRYVGAYKAYYENGCLKQEKIFNSAGHTEMYAYYFPSDTCGLIEMSFNKSGDKKYFKYNRRGSIVDSSSSYQPRNYEKKYKPVIRYDAGKPLTSLCYCEVIVSDTIYTYYDSEYKIVLSGEFSEKRIYTGTCNIYKNDTVLAGSFNFLKGELLLDHSDFKIHENMSDGYHKLFNENKQIYQDGEFKNGKLYSGKIYIYDKNGLLYKIEMYKKGKYVGDAQID